MFSRFGNALAAVAACTAVALCASAQEIKISHQFKANTDGRDKATRLFVEEVGKRDKSLKFRIYPGSSLNIKPVAQLDALRADPGFPGSEAPRDEAWGLVGTTGGDDGPTLILQGHVDVVPPGDLATWDGDPFVPRVTGDLVHGRGACDMKAGLTAHLAALAAIRAAGLRLRGQVAVHFVVGEEDVLTPVADSRLLSRSIPRSRLVVLPQAGHLSNLEVPDEFSRAVEDFLNSNL